MKVCKFPWVLLIQFLCFCFGADEQNRKNAVIERIDPNGYITFCPCMGRFGNQADHYLGVLGFSKGLNRTLILPPWVEYRPGALKSVQVPFETYFKIEPLDRYHRVISMEVFMKTLAPKIWSRENRTVFCYMERQNSGGCNAKEGNPFGPFWDTHDIDFISSIFYHPLTYDIYHQNMAKKWNDKYPANKYSVMAFAGAPASFPVQFENIVLQRFFEWNDDIIKKAKKEVAKLPRGPFMAIHLRNGVDWVRACKHVDQSPNLFAAPQCLGYRGENGVATIELCLPSKDTIVKQLKRIAKKISAKGLFVASDHDHMTDFLSAALSKMNISVLKMENPEPHVELAVMGMANHFIGNCISSFSAFVKRERDVKGFPSSFWAFPFKKKNSRHLEL